MSIPWRRTGCAGAGKRDLSTEVTEINKLFPQLVPGRYRVTSPPDLKYNCIAWAAGDDYRMWWPAQFAYWPRGVDRSSTLEAFIAAFETLGYRRVPNGNLELSVEKIAIYASRSNEPQHAARQLPSGQWASKLGKLEDIEHELSALEGSCYGSVVCFLGRERKRA